MLAGSSLSKKALQNRLNQFCETIFAARGVNQEVEAALLEFLSQVPLSSLNFNEIIAKGQCKGATIFAVLSRLAMFGATRAVVMVLSDRDVLPKLKMNATSKNDLFVGVSPLYFLGFAVLSGHRQPLRLIFETCPLRELNFKVTCKTGAYAQTNLLWLLGLIALKGDPFFIEEVLNKVPLRELELNSTCVQGSADDQNDPFQGESLYHQIAELATQNRPMCLNKVWDQMLETPNVFNAKIMAGPNKGMTVFQQVLEAAARVDAIKINNIPRKWLPGLVWNAKVQGGQSRGTDALYWAAVLAGKFDPSFLERVLTNVSFSKLSFHAVSQEPAYQHLNFLWWLTYAASKKHPKALIKVMEHEKFTAEEFNATCIAGATIGATALFWLTVACATNTSPELLACLDKALNEEDILKLDLNRKYLGDYNKGTTPLFWIALLAAKGYPEMLKRVLRLVPLSQLDLSARCEVGDNQGWSVVHLIGEAATREDDECLLHILNSPLLTPELLNMKQSSGEHKGMSVLMQCIQAATRGRPEALKKIFSVPGILRQLDWRTPCEGGPYLGTNSFWWLSMAAVNGHAEFLEAAIEEIEFTTDDLNTTSEAGNLEDYNALYFVVYLARLGRPKALTRFLLSLPLRKLDFYKTCANGSNEGMSPLGWFVILAVQGNPEFLSIILNDIDFSKADLNTPIENGRYKGTTLLMWISILALMGYQEPLIQVFRQVPFHQLNFNARCEASMHKGITVLWSLAALGSAELLERILEEVPLTELNFNAAALQGPNNGISVLWWFTLYAIQGNPQLLNRVLNDVPLSLLDFTAKRASDNKSIKDLVAGTPLQSKIDFVMHLQQAIKLSRNKKSSRQAKVLQAHLEQTEHLAQIAMEAGHQEAYYWLANFYLNSDDETGFMRVALKISPTDIHFNEIQAQVTRIEQEQLSRQMASCSIEVVIEAEGKQNTEQSDHISDQSSSLALTMATLQDKLIEISTTLDVLQIKDEPVAFIPAKKMIFHDIHQSQIQEPLESANDAELVVPERSMEARKIHRLVMRVCDASNKDAHLVALRNLAQCLETAQASDLMALSVNGYSHLEDALHLPFERQQDALIAHKIAIDLFDCLMTKMQAKLSSEQLSMLMANHSIQKMNLLQQALRNGSQAATQRVIAISENHLEPVVWQNILLSTNEFGYNAFHQAVASGDAAIVQLVIAAFKKAFNDKSDDVLYELGQESWRLFSGKRWRASAEKQLIQTIISPYVDCSNRRRKYRV